MFGSKNYKSFTDANLVERFRNSHDNAFIGELYQRYTHLVYGVCLQYLKNEEESKDAVMEIYEHIISALKKHRVGNFRSWLYSVSKNHCLMKLRKDKSLDRQRDEYERFLMGFMEIDEQTHLLNGEEKEIKLQHLTEGLTNLNEGQRQCLELFYFYNKSYEEIADDTGLNLKQVKSHLQNGKRQLKIYMDKNA
ncbi:MAG: sigma-70 family RNA polymerase sigma factor [Bacteroidia bacterium]